MECVREFILIKVFKIGYIVRVNIKTTIADIGGNKGVDCKTNGVISAHDPVSQQYTPLDTLLDCIESKDVIGVLTVDLCLIHKMAKVGKPYLLSEIPHSGF